MSRFRRRLVRLFRVARRTPDPAAPAPEAQTPVFPDRDAAMDDAAMQALLTGSPVVRTYHIIDPDPPTQGD